MPGKDKYRIKEGKVQTKVELEDTERIRLEKAACDAKGVEYPEDIPSIYVENNKQREFEYFRKLNPKGYSIAVDQLWRVLDERDGKEYIIYHVYKYVTQIITLSNGNTVKRRHQVDSYEGFYHDPDVDAKEFNADGSPSKLEIIKLDKVYTIPWSKETFDKIVDDPLNTITTNYFSLGIASQDASRDLPLEGSTCRIRNREDFSMHDWDNTWRLGRSQLSTANPSMKEVQNTLQLRKKLAAPSSSTETPAAK
jgi:hypothetical protein